MNNTIPVYKIEDVDTGYRPPILEIDEYISSLFRRGELIQHADLAGSPSTQRGRAARDTDFCLKSAILRSLPSRMLADVYIWATPLRKLDVEMNVTTYYKAPHGEPNEDWQSSVAVLKWKNESHVGLYDIAVVRVPEHEEEISEKLGAAKAFHKATVSCDLMRDSTRGKLESVAIDSLHILARTKTIRENHDTVRHALLSGRQVYTFARIIAPNPKSSVAVIEAITPSVISDGMQEIASTAFAQVEAEVSVQGE